MLASVARPGELLRTVSTWGQHGVLTPEDLARLITRKLDGKLLDLDRTLDVAATSDGWAVSLGVTSLDDARASLPPSAKLVPVDNGALRIDGLFDLAEYGSPTQRLHTCELAPSAGPAATRLVCASDDQALGVLAPYLTRTVARGPAPGDIHVEARLDRQPAPDGKRALSVLLSEMLTDSIEPAWLDIVHRFTGEVQYLETDVDKLTLDGKLEDGALRLTLTAAFIAARSQTARMLLSHPDRVDAPPGAFWRLPLDTDFAFFDRGIDNERIEHARDMVLRLLSDALKDKIDAPGRNALTTALSHLVTTPSAAVFARGVDFAAARVAIDAAASDAGRSGAASRRAMVATVGWWMEGLDEPAGRVQAAMAELVRAWNRPAIRAWLAGQDSHPPTLGLEPIPAAMKLPRGTTHLVLAIPSESVGLHLFAVPDARRVWLALGMDATQLAERLRDVVGAPSQTLASRPALEPLKALQASSGGFVTLRGVWTTLPGVFGDSTPADAKARYGEIGGLTDRGSAPLLLTWSSVLPTVDAPAGSVVATARIDRDLVAGLAQLQAAASTPVATHRSKGP